MTKFDVMVHVYSGLLANSDTTRFLEKSYNELSETYDTEEAFKMVNDKLMTMVWKYTKLFMENYGNNN